MNGYMQLAIELGYIQKWGDNQYTITTSGQELATAELSRPQNHKMALEIISMKNRDERGSAYIGVILAIMRYQSNLPPKPGQQL